MSLKLMFHNICGPSIKLSEDRLSACRRNPIDEFDNGWVFSERTLAENEEFQIQILHLISSHYQSLKFGITVENPINLKLAGLLSQNEIFQNSWMLQDDRFYYQNDENIITVEEYDINLSNLQEGDLIGLKINEKRELSFTHNGIPFRTVAEDIPQDVWGFVNLYGRCSFITIIPSKSPITRSQKEKMIKKLKHYKESNQHDENEMSFHSYCGKEIYLSDKNRIAQRKNPTNEFRNAVVISNQPLMTNKLFKLRIEGLVNKWNGSIEFGVTIHNPESFKLPATMTNLRSGTLVLSGNSILTNGHGNQSTYCDISLDDLKIGDEICVKRASNGDIYFLINQNDLGVAGNISIEIDIWVIIDLYGRTIKVSIPNNQPKLALLHLDSTTHLEEVENRLIFHQICGKNVIITQEGYSASRINDQEFNNGVVFTNRPLKIGERWIVKLVRCVSQWSGNLEIGITTLVPSVLDIPCTMTDWNIGYTAMLTSNGLVINGCPLAQFNKSLDLDNVHSVLLTGISSLIEGSTLAIEMVDRDKLQFFINNADLGTITLETDKDIYGVIDLYGKAAEVCINLNDAFTTAQSSNVGKFNDNEVHENEQKLHFDSLLFSDDNSDCDIPTTNHRPLENRIQEMLVEADKSFLKLLTTTDGSEVMDSRSFDQGEMIHFHQIHGKNVILINESRTAYRPSPNNEFKNALVMSSRPLLTDELFEICVEKMTDHWSGSLEMGVTLISPEELNFPGTLSQLDRDCWILSGSCLMNNGITARNDYGLDMDNIHVHSKIGIIRRQTGMLHFLLDGIDMGSAYFDVPPGIYAILDLYGQCSQVSITSKSGIRLSSEHINVSVNPIRELSSSGLLSGDREDSSSIPTDANKYSSRQYISTIERTMSTIKKSLYNTSCGSTGSKLIRNISEKSMLHKDFNCTTTSQEKYSQISSFFCDSIFGVGVSSDGMGNFYTHNQNVNCVIQFKNPLKTNFYYEMLFLNDKNIDYNLGPISCGIISEKFSAANYLPDNLSKIKSPGWMICGSKLFNNNILKSQSFAPTLNRYKDQTLLGLYFYDYSHIEVFIDHVSVGKIFSVFQEECYLLINLYGWFNTLIGLRILSKPPKSLSQPKINLQMLNYTYNNHQSDFQKENNEVALMNEQYLSNVNENLNIDDSLIASIVNSLSFLLPFFFNIMQGIDTVKLAEEVITFNNDIVLCVRKRIIFKHAANLFSNNQKIFETEIEKELIDELSNRFSYLSELQNLASSQYEIARILRRRISWHKICYDDKKSAFIIPKSCLILEESRISRSKSGSQYGLCILNQELRSKLFSSFEIQLLQSESIESNDSNSLFLGLILLESNHFPNVEDVFRFLMNVSCPRHINLLSNVVNHCLELQNFESKAAILTVKENCVYFNEKKICQHLPFNSRTVSNEDFMSFSIVDNESEISDIYLSVRNKNSTSNYKIFSQHWLKTTDTIKSALSTRNTYYYVPFIWLKNQSKAVLIADSKDKSISLNEIPQMNQQNWLEKHYQDELNKESTHMEINNTLIQNKQNRQCVTIFRSSFIKKALTLPDICFHHKLVDCFCNNCHYPINIVNSEPAKEFRLPVGWVKFNTKFIKDEKGTFSLWKTAYLTVSSGLLHRLFTSSNPNRVLVNFNPTISPQINWLKSCLNSTDSTNKTIVVSPWQPLNGCYLNDDCSIKQCIDSQINCFDPVSNSEIKARIALEVKVKPNSFKNIDCKIVVENQLEIKRIIPQIVDMNENKKQTDFNVIRPINPKTVWIINGVENTMVISGLLIKI